MIKSSSPILLLVILCGGCDTRPQAITANKVTEPGKHSRWQKGSSEAAEIVARGGSPSESKKRKGNAVPLEHAKLSSNAWRPGNSSDGSYGSRGSSYGSRSETQAMQQIGKVLKQSIEVGPTLVVWVVDRTDSASKMVTSALNAGKTLYADEAIAAAAKEEKLLSAVVGFGDAAEFLLDPPTAELDKLLATFDAVKSTPGSREATFTSLATTLDKYLPFRRKENRELLFVLITDEPGDDLQKLEEVVTATKKNVIPIYVIGSTVPLGRPANEANTYPPGMKPAATADTRTTAVDALHSDLPPLDFWSGRFNTSDTYDSGLGPWALERLCRESGGMFLGVGSASSGGAMSSRVEPAIMNKYAPDNVSVAAYDHLLAENKCRDALVKVAVMERAEAMLNPQLQFPKGNNEARNVQMLNKAQRDAARIEPQLNKIFDALTAAEGDRAKLTGLRWQAAYDTAFGRACAAKVRVDGYNAMVAALKRGKNFVNKESNTWIIEPSDAIETGSAQQKLADKAKLYLERVQKEHPDTPWARMASDELQTPLGWSWKEQ